MPITRTPVTDAMRQDNSPESASDYRTFIRALKMQQPCAQLDGRGHVIICGKCSCVGIIESFKRNPILDGNVVRDERSHEVDWDGSPLNPEHASNESRENANASYAVDRKTYLSWMSEAWES